VHRRGHIVYYVIGYTGYNSARTEDIAVPLRLVAGTRGWAIE